MCKQVLPQDAAVIRQLLQQLWAETEEKQITRLGGLTNHTYRVTTCSGEEYVFRLPGDGTEEIICRADEKISTTLACSLAIDSEMLYFDDKGIKIMRHIPDAVTMSAEQLKKPEHIRQVADVFRRLHGSGADTGVPFEVFDMAAGYEKIIREMEVPLFEDYAAIKQEVMSMKSRVDSVIDIRKVPCHNDPLCENWILGKDRMYLIDWEYAGMNDGMWDVADVAIEAGFSPEEEQQLLTAYLQREPETRDLQHFYANKIYVDYLWTLWAKARVPYSGQDMEDWAQERYARMKESMDQFRKLSV